MRGGLTQWKFIFLPFWRPEVQGVGVFCFFRVLSPWLADGRFVPVSSHGLSSVWEHPWGLSVCPNSLFLQGHRQSDQISAHSNSLILTNYLFKLNSSQPSPDLTSLQPGRGHVRKMRGLRRPVHPETPAPPVGGLLPGLHTSIQEAWKGDLPWGEGGPPARALPHLV